MISNQVFARKVFHSGTTSEAARKEIQTHEALSKKGHENIIHVFKTGMLPHSLKAFIDMELCEMNLETYNSVRWKDPSALGQEGPRKTWDIIGQIAAGLVFLRENRAIHRDLKPQNGKCFGKFCTKGY